MKYYVDGILNDNVDLHVKQTKNYCQEDIIN